MVETTYPKRSVEAKFINALLGRFKAKDYSKEEAVRVLSGTNFEKLNDVLGKELAQAVVEMNENAKAKSKREFASLTTEEKKEQFKCPVCWSLIVQPVITECKHSFCLKCHQDIVERRLACPMCRSP